MQDVIAQEISINAGLERVWDLVTEPGWWVPSDEPVEADRTPGSRTVRTSEKYGSFPVEVVEIRPRTYAAFRWSSQFPNEEPTPTRSTLIEFFLSETADAPVAAGTEETASPAGTTGTVLVKVRESGFAHLEAPEEIRQAGVDSNTEGWRLELGELKKRSEEATSSR